MKDWLLGNAKNNHLIYTHVLILEKYNPLNKVISN